MSKITDALMTEGAQKIDEQREVIRRLRSVLLRCESYFDERADAEIFVDGPVGNEEMKLLLEVREELRRSK